MFAVWSRYLVRKDNLKFARLDRLLSYYIGFNVAGRGIPIQGKILYAQL